MLSFEAEMRALEVEPEPSPKERVRATNVHHQLAVDHKRRAPNTRPATQEHLPANKPTANGGPEVRLCDKCQKPGHLARNYSDGGAGPSAPRDKGDKLAAHKTPGLASLQEDRP